MARTISWAFLGLTVVALLAGTAVAQQQLQQVEQEVQIEEDPFADDPQGNQAPQSPVPKLKPAPFESKDGKRKGWMVTMPGGRPLATPAVVDGKVFIGGGFGSHEFYALDAKTGKSVWQYRTADDGPTAAVVDAGYVSFNTESCELEILTLAGKPVWKKWLGDPLMSMPAIDNGRVYMAFPNSRGDRNHYLACFDLKTGKEHWRKKIAGEIITAPMVDDAQVFLATLEGTLYCFHAKDGLLAWTEKGKNATSSPTVAEGRCWFSRREAKTEKKEGKDVKQQMEQLAVRPLQKKANVHDLLATSRVADYLDYAKRRGFGGAGVMGGVMGGGMGGGMGGAAFGAGADAFAAPAAGAAADPFGAPGAGSPKEAASQAHDAGVGFAGGGIGLTEEEAMAQAPEIDETVDPFAEPKPEPKPPVNNAPNTSQPAPAPDPFAAPPANSQPVPQQNAAQQVFGGGGKGDSKMAQAMGNLGQGSVHGVWSYQGSKPIFYKGRLYSSMGDAMLCVDPKTEKVIWKKEFHGKLDAKPQKPQPKKDAPKKDAPKKKRAKKKRAKKPKVLLDAMVSPPAVTNDKVFLGTGHGEIVCLAADTGNVLWSAATGKSIVFQPVVADGRVYVSSESGNLYCLETGDPKDTGWRMWGANAAHTGRAGAK